MDRMYFYYAILCLISLVSAWVIFKPILRIAKMKNIVDNPDVRKLHRAPVPVLGGIVIFFGMIVSMICSELLFDNKTLFAIMGVMTVMLYIGTMDDILSLPWHTRFVIETAVIVALIYCNRYSLNNFHGLWGIYVIPDYIAVPLTVFACVGIMNAVNLMDGVNGLCSGYCIFACIIFAGVFIYAGVVETASLALISIGALIPFFFHNVFGLKSRMFIGDGGTLLMGTVLSAFLLDSLGCNSLLAETFSESLGLIPFVMAVFSIPVFDTLRVMVMRIVRKKSPFSPDKTHLHHLFIDLGFSHIGITVIEVLSNLFVVAAWWFCYKAGLSVDNQLYVVIAISFAFTFGFYKFARIQMANETKLYFHLKRIGQYTHVGSTGFFCFCRTVMDKNCD